MAYDVSDARSNPNEQLEHAARVVGRSLHRRQVFEAIYRGKRRVKSVTEIMTATGLPRMRVLQEGKHLVNNHVVRQKKVAGEVAYEKDDFYHINKALILRLVSDPKKLAEYPTKRKLRTSVTPTVDVRLNVNLARAKTITIDDIDNFALVREVAPSGFLTGMSEDRFKQGIKSILGQLAEFSDWGGEKNDLITSYVKVRGVPIRTAFAFKGPGMKVAELTPGKLGKNGDQIQRLFQSNAQIYLVQYWRGIAESVMEQMQQLAIAASVMRNLEIRYGVIDGQDSMRLVTAYGRHFK